MDSTASTLSSSESWFIASNNLEQYIFCTELLAAEEKSISDMKISTLGSVGMGDVRVV
jgi:hypothetical protein